MAAPKKNLKATKKFEKKHLKGVLDKRKAVAKVKQRAQIKAKQQAKRKGDADFYKGPADGAAAAGSGAGAGAGAGARSRRPDAAVSAMSVDDFFQGGFQILDGDAAHLGKRKRNGQAAAAKTAATETDEDASDGSDGSGGSDGSDADPVAPSDDSDDEDELDVDAVGMSKEAMEALAEKDPEFYAFLRENDPEALAFDDADEADDDDDKDDDSGAEDDGRPKKKAKTTKAAKAAVAVDNELTRDMVAKWAASMEQTHSLRALRQMVVAFRCAAHLDEADDEGGASRANAAPRYAIKSPDVFHDLVVAALDLVPRVLQHHVPVKESAARRAYVATDGRAFRAVAPLVRSFAAAVLHLLTTTLSDDATRRRTLAALMPLLPYLLSFRKVLKQLVRAVVGVWAQPSATGSGSGSGSSASDTAATRLTAFLVLRRLAVIGDRGVREAVLKAAYQGLLQGCRATNANTLAAIHLMKNAAVELWGLDPALAYATAFASIRQLAIHLRTSIVHNQNSAFRAVYNWQYVHALDFWSRVLAEHASASSVAAAAAAAATPSQMPLLVYPLVQVTLGAMRLIPTAAYFPLRFHLVRALLRLSRATGTYVPLAPALLEVLNAAEMKRAPGTGKGSGAKSAADRPLDFAVAYKAPKSLLHTPGYQAAVGEQVVELLAEYFALWSTSIAFPELALPVVITLKRWIKDARRRAAKAGRANRNPGPAAGAPSSKVISGLALVVQKLEANSAFITTQRAHVTFAPRDRTAVDAFLKDFDWQKTPVGAFVVAQRKIAEERQRVLDETRQHEEARRQAEKQQLQAARAEEEGEDDEDMEDEDGEDEDMDNVDEGEEEEDDDDDEDDE